MSTAYMYTNIFLQKKKAPYSYIKWDTIFAGAFVSISSLITIYFASSYLDNLFQNNNFNTIAIALLFLNCMISFGVGGYLTGRLYGFTNKQTLVLHGILSSSLTLLITVFICLPLTQYHSSYSLNSYPENNKYQASNLQSTYDKAPEVNQDTLISSIATLVKDETSSLSKIAVISFISIIIALISSAMSSVLGSKHLKL
jgi:hypothetical protein